MIKITATLAALLLTNALIAQQDSLRGKPFNRWSVEVNAGQNKAIKPFSEGYYSANPDKYFNFTGVNHFDAGVRYMLSDRFGLKLDGGYDLIENQKGSGSLPFSTKSYRIGLQGVVNVGHILNFESFTHRFGLLAHGGMQVSRFKVTSSRQEDNGGVMLGLTPQLRLTRWCALTGDFTYIGNVRQHYTWDGELSPAENNLTGGMVHTSLGLTFYLGGKDSHADWYISEPPVAKADAETKKRLDTIETLMNDTDKDGVPDYLDSENNTPNGVAVDTKGRAFDLNKNGIPDDMERRQAPSRIDQDFSIGGDSNTTNNSGGILALKQLVENGSINIFYNVLMDTPNSGSTNNVYMILQYLNEHPQSKIQLTGYADRRGSELQNKDLSQRRAMNLKRLFVKSGIAEDRITIAGQGVDNAYPETKTGLDLARRVSVKLIK